MIKILAIWLPASFATGALTVWLAAAALDPSESGQALDRAIESGDSAAAPAAGRDDAPAESRAGREGTAPVDALARAVLGEAGAGLSASELSLLLRRWAGTDPTAFLAALPTLAAFDPSLARWSQPSPLLDALRLAAEVDSGPVFELGEQHAGGLGHRIRAAALEALAEQDPEAALAHLDAVDPGEVRDRLLAAVATGFARGDLNGAVAWLATLTEIDGAAFYPVINAVALVDLSRAIELDIEAIELDYGGLDFGSLDWLRNGLSMNRHVPARIADQLAALRGQGLLADTLSWWATEDPYGAIAWIQSQSTIPSMVVERLASELARQDYAQAMNLADQFPPAVRVAWLGAVIGRAAEYDIAAARDALEALRAESIPVSAVIEVLRAANQSLGARAAAEMAGASPPVNVTSEIVTAWARSDPAAAAAWVASIEDPRARSRALYPLLSDWMEADPVAAQSWVQNLADDDFRARSVQTLSSICFVRATCAAEFK